MRVCASGSPPVACRSPSRRVGRQSGDKGEQADHLAGNQARVTDSRKVPNSAAARNCDRIKFLEGRREGVRQAPHSLSHCRGPQNGLDILRPDNFVALGGLRSQSVGGRTDFVFLCLFGILFCWRVPSRTSYYCNIVTGVNSPVLAKHSKHFLLEDAFSIGVDRMQRNFDPMRATGRTLASAAAIGAGGEADDLPGFHRRRSRRSETPCPESTRTLFQSSARGVQAANDVEPVKRVHLCIQGTGPNSAV